MIIIVIEIPINHRPVWMNPMDLTYTASRSLIAIASRYSSNSNCMLKSVWLKCSNKTRLFPYRPKITGPFLAYPISHFCTQDLVVFWLTLLKIIVGLGIQAVVTVSFSPCRLQFSTTVFQMTLQRALHDSQTF